ncbi:MAG: dethiobiotin synthase [Nitrososphaeraceae archaeon]
MTGTDTNIGKTFIACTIAKVLKEHGVDVGVMKPFATSYKRYSSTCGSEDAWRLSRAAKVVDPYDLINPYFYQIGTAPFLAATMSGRPTPNLGFAARKLRRLSRQHEFLVVEGIGGVMVPISRKETILDFIKMVGFPVIIVTSPKLGTINHTLLTFQACLNRKIRVDAIIINKNPEKTSKVQRRLPIMLSTFTGVKRVIEIPRIRNSYTLKNIENLIAQGLLDFRN